MKRAMAIFQVGEEEELHMLGAGEQIGRSDMAALCLDDPRISEAHAMVSLRGQGLKLLALRGRFRVDGEPVNEVELKAGLRAELAPGFFIMCVEVCLPCSVLTVEFAEFPKLTPTGTTTLHARPKPHLKYGYDPKGDAILWPIGERWRLQFMESGETVELEGEHSFEVCGERLEIRQTPLMEMAHTRTKSTIGESPRIEPFGGCVKIWRDGTEERSVMITGIPGKICAAVIELGHAAPVHDIIRVVWPDDASLESALRKRFDMGLSRLRDRLTQLGFDAALIDLDGTGMLTLNLHALSTLSLASTSARGHDGSL